MAPPRSPPQPHHPFVGLTWICIRGTWRSWMGEADMHCLGKWIYKAARLRLLEWLLFLLCSLCLSIIVIQPPPVQYLLPASTTSIILNQPPLTASHSRCSILSALKFATPFRGQQAAYNQKLCELESSPITHHHHNASLDPSIPTPTTFPRSYRD
jgi:hypothetical protein